MKKLLIITMLLSLALVACERQNRPNHPSSNRLDNENTGKNVRDRDAMTKTPEDQSESEMDRKITQKIRQIIMSDNALSTDAKNIKIISENGVVTLRGPVASEEEKDAIVRKVHDVQGIVDVDNQLEVAD